MSLPNIPLAEVTVLLNKQYMHNTTQLIPIFTEYAALHTEWQSSFSGILMGIMPKKYLKTLGEMPEVQKVYQTGIRY